MSSPVIAYLLVCGLTFALSWGAARVLGVGPIEVRRGGGTGIAAMDYRYAFDSARGRHGRAWLLAVLTGRRSALTLRVLPCCTLAGGVDEGERDVPLSDIVGSVDGGHHPFDRNFDPSEDAAWSRFSRVLAARTHGVSLPPVLLLHARDGYYVLDGHHRVAVARAFGDRDIRAQVTRVAC
ncbi:MAG: hypothetical protein ACXVW6_01560 [Nocardioidaceae bacterium]